MSQVVVDADVASYIFNWHSLAQSYVNLLRSSKLILSFMSIAELRIGGNFGGLERQRRALLEQFMQGFELVYADDSPCTIWARIRADARAAGRGLSPQDAWVGPTALAPAALRDVVGAAEDRVRGAGVPAQRHPLKKGQHDLVNRTVWVPDSKTPNGVAEVPLTDIAVAAFTKQLAISGPGDYLFRSDEKASGHQKTFKTAWHATLRRAKVSYFRIYDLRSTYATRLSAGGVADEWVTQLLRQDDAKAFKKYSQMKLQMNREGLAKLSRQEPETGPGFWHSSGKGTAKAMEARSMISFGISRRFGRGGQIRTGDPLRPRQVRYQAALRPDRCCSLILSYGAQLPLRA
jgi:integrase